MTDSTLPLVSIGLPVYNGLPYLDQALRTLLAQDYPNCELIVADNASTDGTAELCRRNADNRPHMRYIRNPENIGALRNFLLVLAEARGEYFMWAAHDDHWNAQFVSSLMAQLQANSDAVLATPVSLGVNVDGTLRSDPPDRPAAGQSGIGNLKSLLDDHAASWFYGIYRTNWLRAHLSEMQAYPAWGNDMLWLASVALRFPVVGSQQAIMFKRLRPSGFAPRGARAVLWFWLYMLWYFSRDCWRFTGNWCDRSVALAITWRYVYRIGMRRSNPVSTVWRVLRIVTLSSLSLIPLMLAGAAARLKRKLAPSAASN